MWYLYLYDSWEKGDGNDEGKLQEQVIMLRIKKDTEVEEKDRNADISRQKIVQERSWKEKSYLTHVAKVPSRRHVQELIEDVPAAVGTPVTDLLPCKWTILEAVGTKTVH